MTYNTVQIYMIIGEQSVFAKTCQLQYAPHKRLSMQTHKSRTTWLYLILHRAEVVPGGNTGGFCSAVNGYLQD